MNRFPQIVRAVAAFVFEVADAKHSGRWCTSCDDFKTDECSDGTCQDPVREETYVDHAAFQHWPTVDFGGGD